MNGLHRFQDVLPMRVEHHRLQRVLPFLFLCRVALFLQCARQEKGADARHHRTNVPQEDELGCGRVGTWNHNGRRVENRSTVFA